MKKELKTVILVVGFLLIIALALITTISAFFNIIQHPAYSAANIQQETNTVVNTDNSFDEGLSNSDEIMG